MVFSFNKTTREVLEQIVREPRFQELTKLPVFAPMEIALAVTAFTAFFTGSWLYLAGEINFLLMLLINSIAIYASFTPLHDATHRAVSSNRKVNDLIGTVCCLLLLPGITTRIYRYLHLEHHRYAGNRNKDPDEPFVSASNWALPFILAGLDVHWSLWYLKRWHTRPKSERTEFIACLTFYIGLHVVFLLSPYAMAFFLCFMIPQRFGLFYVSWFFAHIQHPEGAEWEHAPFQTTVRVKTNTVANILLLGQSFHCLHHLAPSIPYYRYKRAWELGAHLFEQHNIPTRTLWRKSNDLKLPSLLTPKWLTATVTSVASVAENVCAFELTPTNQEVWPPFNAGAHIDVKLNNGLIRQYSLCNDPSDRQRYRIAVKLDPNSSGGSSFMHSQVTQGSSLIISLPRNNFPLRTDFGHYVLIAAGIGMTPLLAMAHELHTDNRSFELHLFARKESDVAFHETLKKMPFSKFITLHSNEGNTTARSMVTGVVTRYKPADGLYLCGPTEFMANVIVAAKRKSWPDEAISSETFVPAYVDESENKPFEVKIASTGKILSIAANEQLIDVLHRNGYMVMCSCTQGICGSCITPVIEGIPEHRDAIMSDAQRSKNNTMTVCVSRSQSKRLVLDL